MKSKRVAPVTEAPICDHHLPSGAVASAASRDVSASVVALLIRRLTRRSHWFVRPRATATVSAANARAAAPEAAANQPAFCRESLIEPSAAWGLFRVLARVTDR